MVWDLKQKYPHVMAVVEKLDDNALFALAAAVGTNLSGLGTEDRRSFAAQDIAYRLRDLHECEAEYAELRDAFRAFVRICR